MNRKVIRMPSDTVMLNVTFFILVSVFFWTVGRYLDGVPIL